MTVTAEPPIGAGQRVVLLLDAAGGGQSYSFRAPARVNEDDPVEVLIAGVAAGTYLVRIQVDGAESLLELEQERFAQPTLTIP